MNTSALLEWIAQGDRAISTGGPEQGLVFISKHRNVANATIAAYERANLENTLVLTPIHGWIPGIAAVPNNMGIPTICYITSPPHLISWDKHNHLDKFDAKRMHAELEVVADLMRVLGSMSTADLQAGAS